MRKWLLVVCITLSGCADGPAPYVPIRAEALARRNVCGWVVPDGAEPAAIRANHDRVNRAGATLHIGKVSLTNNDEEGGSYVRYTYVGRLADAPFDLVHLGLYEGESWFLIDDAGGQLEVGGPPLVSPNRSWVAVLADGFPYDASKGVIYALTGSTLSEVFEQEILPPCEAGWRGSDILELRSYPENWSGRGAPRLTPARIVRRRGAWKYDGPVGPAR